MHSNNVCRVSYIFSPTNRRRPAVTRKAATWSTPTWTTVICIMGRSITNNRLETLTPFRRRPRPLVLERDSSSIRFIMIKYYDVWVIIRRIASVFDRRTPRRTADIIIL